MLKTRQLNTFQQHFFFRLSSFPQQVKRKKGQEHSFHVTHPPPTSSTILPIYMQSFKVREGRRHRTSSHDGRDSKWWEAGVSTVWHKRRVKGHAGWDVVAFTHAGPVTSALKHTDGCIVMASALPVRGGQEVDCSVPDSAGHHWHGCCKPAGKSGETLKWERLIKGVTYCRQAECQTIHL